MDNLNTTRVAAGDKHKPRRDAASHSTETDYRSAADQKALLASWEDTLLKPSQVWSPHELVADLSQLPLHRGVYGWWFRTAPARVPIEGTIENSFGRLLYVGIAGRGAKKRTLRDRLKNHLRGPIGSSTLRRTLACLNAEELGLHIVRHPTSDRLMMSGADEAKLSKWMAEEARVAWVLCDRPQDLEREILLRGPSLPLNIRGSSASFARHLSTIRAQAGKQASQA